MAGDCSYGEAMPIVRVGLFDKCLARKSFSLAVDLAYSLRWSSPASGYLRGGAGSSRGKAFLAFQVIHRTELTGGVQRKLREDLNSTPIRMRNVLLLFPRRHDRLKLMAT